VQRRRVGWARHVAGIAETMNVQRILVGKREDRRQFVILHADGDNIKIYLTDENEDLYFILLAQGMDQCQAVVNTVMNFWIT
jgi:hypothetical protein